MLSDLLSGERCPHCGCNALHPEAKAGRVGSFEVLTLESDPTRGGPAMLRQTVYLVECGACRGLWPIPYLGEIVTDAAVRDWLTQSPTFHHALKGLAGGRTQ